MIGNIKSLNFERFRKTMNDRLLCENEDYKEEDDL